MTAASAVTYYAMYYQNAQGWYSGTVSSIVKVI